MSDRLNPARVRIGLLFLLLCNATVSSRAQLRPQSAPGPAPATLSGHVVDEAGRPVAATAIKLQGPDGRARAMASDAAGSFAFSDLAPGTYSVRAQGSSGQATVQSFVLSSAGTPAVRLVLPSSVRDAAGSAPGSGEAIKFSDEPNFAIAGVTDWTAAGGHGSDATLRTSEDLTRKTLTLTGDGRDRAAAPAANSADATQEQRLRAAAAAAPQSYAAVHSLGAFYLQSARYEQAVAPLKRASELSHGAAEDEYDLALACRGVGDAPQARAHLERALTQSDAAKYHRLSGEVDEALGDPLGAVHEEEHAARLDPSEENYFTWGSELLLHRAVRQAAEVFSRGAMAHPSSARMRTGWGAALFADARYEEAAQQLCSASDLEPENPEPYRFLGKAVLTSPAPLPGVQQRLERFLDRRPGDADASYFYAMFLLKQSPAPDLQRVSSLLRRAIALRPDDADAYLQLGTLSFQQGDYARAITLYKQALAADPQQADAHYRLGIAYHRAGEPELARQQFALRDQLVEAQALAVEQERRQVKQFLVVLDAKANRSSAP